MCSVLVYVRLNLIRRRPHPYRRSDRSNWHTHGCRDMYVHIYVHIYVAISRRTWMDSPRFQSSRSCRRSWDRAGEKRRKGAKRDLGKCACMHAALHRNVWIPWTARARKDLNDELDEILSLDKLTGISCEKSLSTCTSCIIKQLLCLRCNIRIGDRYYVIDKSICSIWRRSLEKLFNIYVAFTLTMLRGY